MWRPDKQALIITNEPSLQSSLSAGLASCGLTAVSVPEVQHALRALETDIPDCIVLDLDSNTVDMSELLLRVGEGLGMHRLLLLVSERSMPLAAAAMESGAQWHLRKPVAPAELRLAVERLHRPVRTEQPVFEDAIYGSSPEIQAVLKMMSQAADRDVHVTIHGEPGSGKRLIARVLHQRSRRRGARMRHFSSAGLSERVAETDLFGSGRAAEGSKGLLDASRGGTLFVDEVDLLHVNIQRRLFSQLTERQSRDDRALRAHGVRLIAASSRNLERWVHEGRFHSGLFDLIDGVRIHLPPLREHKSDIPILVDHFFRRAAARSGRSVQGIAPEAMARLMRYDWPGNVRELGDLIDHALVRTVDTVLGVDALPSLPETAESQRAGFPERATIQEIEREAILRTLESAGGSTSRAARILNMSVRKIQYKLKEYRGDAGTALRVERVRAAAASKTAPAKKTEFVARPRSKD